MAAGETQACADAAAERVAFLEDQIGGLNAEGEAAAAAAEAALKLAREEAAQQLAALQAQLATAQVCSELLQDQMKPDNVPCRPAASLLLVDGTHSC
jgi:hypothetical protein